MVLGVVEDFQLAKQHRPPFVGLPLHHIGEKVGDQQFAIVDIDDIAAVGGYRWSINAKGYVGRTIHPPGGEKPFWVYLHRTLMGCTPGDGTHVDHRNGNRLDNRRLNLKVRTPSLNGHNRGRPNRNSTTGYRNVSATTHGGWQVRVSRDRVSHYGGTFETLEAAVDAAAELRAKLYPEIGGVDQGAQSV